MAGAGPRNVGALAAVALHALAGFAFLGYEPARSALVAAAPIMVDLITPPKVDRKPNPRIEVAPPKPGQRPVVERQPEQPEPQPSLSAPLETPSPAVAPPPPPQPPASAGPQPVDAVPAPAPVPVTPPVFDAAYLDNPPPSYPALSRRLREEGRVLLRVLVNTAGDADEVQIRASSGHARLDEAARDTVRRWKFIPARRGQHPVAAWVLVPVSFRLEG